jgi:hypothetical protein
MNHSNILRGIRSALSVPVRFVLWCVKLPWENFFSNLMLIIGALAAIAFGLAFLPWR